MYRWRKLAGRAHGRGAAHGFKEDEKCASMGINGKQLLVEGEPCGHIHAHTWYSAISTMDFSQ
jgi:hypothetical protein